MEDKIKELEQEIDGLQMQLMGYQLHPEYENGWLSGSNAAWQKCEREILDLEVKKDGAYNERNRLVAILASLFPSSLEPHEGEDWGEDWRWVCIIDLPFSQVSWHIKTDELDLFSHVPRNQGRKWDGHTTEEKYKRIEEACKE